MEEPLRAIELALRFPDQASRSKRVDDVAYLRAEALLRLERPRDAIVGYTAFQNQYPASPLRYDALDQVEYLRECVVPVQDASSRLAGLIAEFAGGQNREEMTLRLAEIYADELKDFASARKQLNSLLSDDSTAQETAEQASSLLLEVIWKEYLRNVRGEDGSRLNASDQNEELASKAAEEMSDVLQSVTSNEVKARASWWGVLLGRDQISGAEQHKYMQRAVQDHLAEYPDAPFAGDAYLALGRAFAFDDDGQSVGGRDDPAIWYLEVFRDDYRNHPRYAEGLLLLANRYADAKRFADAGRTYRDVIRLGPSPERVQAALALRDPNRTKQDEGSREALEWARTEAWYHPAVADARSQLIQDLLDQRDYHEAEKELSVLKSETFDYDAEWLLNGGDPPELAYLSGRIFEGIGETGRAREAYLRSLARNPAGTQAGSIHLRLAALRIRQGYPEAALRHYRSVLSGPAGGRLRAEAVRGAALVLFQQEQYDAARRYALQVKGANVPQDTAYTYAELAVLCLYRTGKLDEGRSEANEFRKTWSRHDGLYDTSARFELERGKWYSRNGNYPAAEKHYDRVLSRYKNSKWVPEAKYELGRDLLEQNRFDRGLELLIELPKRHPGAKILGKVWWILGNHYAQHGNIMDAVATYDKVLEDSTYKDLWPYVLVNQIRAYRQAGFYAGALQAAQRYLQLYPDAPDKFERRMDVGMMYHQLGQYDLAIRELRDIQPLADVENEAAIQFYIAEALEKSGRLAEAVVEYRKVDYLGKRTKMQWAVTALYNAGRVLERLNEPDRALEMYREIVRREGLASPFGRKANEQIQRLESDRG
jgi:tetratricopeptide (TPR) repeat protein